MTVEVTTILYLTPILPRSVFTTGMWKWSTGLVSCIWVPFLHDKCKNVSATFPKSLLYMNYHTKYLYFQLHNIQFTTISWFDLYGRPWFEEWHHFSDTLLISSCSAAPFSMISIFQPFPESKNILFTNGEPTKWRCDTSWLGIFLAKFGAILARKSSNLCVISVPFDIIFHNWIWIYYAPFYCFLSVHAVYDILHNLLCRFIIILVRVY